MRFPQLLSIPPPLRSRNHCDFNTLRLYCGWLVRAHREKQSLPRDLRKCAEQLATQHGGVLTVGAHKGAFFDEVLDKYPGYGDWAGLCVL